MGLVINQTIEELFLIENEISIGGICFLFLSDEIQTSDPGDLVSDLPYIVLSLDTEKLYPSIHSYPFFTSFCEINGKLFATGDSGIYEITGNTDDGNEIHTGMVFKTDFGITNIKKIQQIIFDGDVENVLVKVESGGKTGTYSLTGNKCFVGRDVIGKDWDLRIVDFERLDGLEIIPNIGRRR